MVRIKAKRILICFIIALGVIAYCLVFILNALTLQTNEKQSEITFNLLTVRPSSNIYYQSRQQIKQHKQHGQKVSDKVSSRSKIEWQLNHDSPPRNPEELKSYRVPNIVFFIWCGNRTFEYQHYLSVRSVWTFLEPEILEIHYEVAPKQDRYNDWLELLKSSIANLALKQLMDWNRCDPCDNIVGDFLRERGGIYVSSDTVILNSLHEYRNTTLSVFFDDKDVPKVIFSGGQTSHVKDGSCYSKSNSFKKLSTGQDNNTRRCLDFTHSSTYGTGVNKTCVFNIQNLSPKDIFTGNDPLKTTFREISYGKRDPIVPVTGEPKIPRIVHYIWYNSANMTFIMYLSILSSLHVIKADRIYIHGGKSLEGHYWEKVKVNPRVQTVDRVTPRDIFGHQILYTHHKSDVIRADILYKYGGIYVDWDVLWLKPVNDLLSAGNDVIVNFDHMPRYPFPDSVNMGVVLSKPRAKYIDLWRKTYRNYRSEEFYYNPIEVPYKIYEMYPSLVRIEPRLQVMCYQLKCHPVFHPEFKNFDSSQPFDWRKDVYSIHFTYPDPEEYKSETALKSGHGMFAEIGKYILNSVTTQS